MTSRAGKRRKRRIREVAPVVFGGVLAVTVLAGLAFAPARTWLSQRENLTEAEAEADRVEAEVAELERQLDLLQTDDEIERRARRDFDLVYPGEESYRILPPLESDSD